MSIRNSPHDCIIDLHHRTTVRGGPSHSQTLGSVAVGVNQVSVGRLWVRVGVGVPTIRSTRVGSEDDLGSTFGLCETRQDENDLDGTSSSERGRTATHQTIQHAAQVSANLEGQDGTIDNSKIVNTVLVTSFDT
jgi:hypothetical protein